MYGTHTTYGFAYMYMYPSYPTVWVLHSWFYTLVTSNLYIWLVYKAIAGYVATLSSVGLLVYIGQLVYSSSAWSPGLGRNYYLAVRKSDPKFTSVATTFKIAEEPSRA